MSPGRTGPSGSSSALPFVSLPDNGVAGSSWLLRRKERGSRERRQEREAAAGTA